MPFKRRSSTRVGRRAPRSRISGDGATDASADLTFADLTRTRSETRVTRPIVRNDQIYRVLQTFSGQIVVEEWTHGYWRPSLDQVADIRSSPVASNELLVMAHVPQEDWLPRPNLPWIAPTIFRLFMAAFGMVTLRAMVPLLSLLAVGAELAA